jgi:hypothetical protein
MLEKWESLVMITTLRNLPLITQAPLSRNGITLPTQSTAQVTEAVGAISFSSGCPAGKQELVEVPHLASLGSGKL